MFAMPDSLPISNTTFETAAGFWFEILARATLQSLVVLAVISLFWLLLRRHVSHAFAHGLFLLVPARFAAVVLFGLLAFEMPMEIPLPFISPPVKEIARSDAIPEVVEISAPISRPEPSIPLVDSEPFADFANQPAESQHFETSGSQPARMPEALQVESIARPGFEWPSPSVILFGAWFGICSILAVRFLIASLVMHFRLKRTGLRSSPGLSAIVADAASDIGLRRCPSVVTTTAVHSPAVFGLIRPKLLIPEGFETAFDEAEIRWAIAHEMAHLKRRDLWSVAFERAIGLAGFFHPALWLARRATANFRELACDDLAGNVTGLPPRKCAETFLKILIWADRQPAHAADSPLVLGMNPRYPAILRRIENMTDLTSSKRPTQPGRMSAVALAFLAMAFSLPVVPKLVAMGPGLSGKAEGDSVIRTDQENPIEQKATAEKSIRLRLIDRATGKPVKDAEVVYVIDQAPKETLRTDEAGIALIPFDAGKMRTLRYRTSLDGYVDTTESWSRDRTLDFPPPAEIERKIKRSVAIGGKIVDMQGQPIEGVDVTVIQSVKSIDRNGDSKVKNMTIEARTDASGTFTIDRFDPDAIGAHVYVSHPRFVRADKEVPKVREPDLLPDLLARRYVSKMQPGKSVSGTVLGPDGKPVEGATIWNDDGTDYFEKIDARSGAEGKFRAGNFGELGRGGFRMAVHKPGVGWAIERVIETEIDKPRTFRLAQPRRLVVTVRDADGKPLAGARVLNSFVTDDMWKDPARLTGPDGRYVVQDLPAAELQISAHLDGFESRHLRVDTISNESVEIVLKPTYAIEGSVTDAVTGQPVDRYRVEQLIDMKNLPQAYPLDSERSGNRFRILRTMHFADEGMNESFRLRIEAEGYESFDTDSIPAHSRQAPLKIALKPLGPEWYVSGRVLRPDGTPAAGAAVGYFSSRGVDELRYLPALRNGKVVGMQFVRMGQDGMTPWTLIRTGADGTFRFPAHFASMGWVVSHDSGILKSRGLEPRPASPVELKLEPWSRVEGQLFVDGEPAAETLVRIDYPFAEHRQPFFPTPGVNQDQPVRTDAEGRFRFENVLPGEFRLSYGDPGTPIQTNRFAGTFETRAGETLRIETRKSDFHFEEIAFAPDGKEVARSEFGSDRPGFRIYGKITDAETGKPVLGTWSYAFSGYDLVKDVWVAPTNSMSGKFETQAITPLPPDVKPESVNPWLIVVSDGYEPYVSPDRIRNEGKAVRRDVKLKPIDKSKWNVYKGRVERADGSRANGVRIDFTVGDPGIKIGDVRFRWAMWSNVIFRTNDDGTFEFAFPRVLDRLVFTDGESVAVVKAAEFALGENRVAKMGEFARIEGRLTRGGKPLEKLGIWLDQGLIPSSTSLIDPQREIRPDGTFTISKVMPGPVTILFNDAKDLSKVTRLRTVQLECKPGETARVEVDVDATAQQDQKPQSSATSKPVVPDSKPIEGQVLKAEGDSVIRTNQENPIEQKATAEKSIRLRLIDRATGKPVKDAEVLSFADFTRTIRKTDANGLVTVDFDPQRHHSLSLLIRHPGYVPVQEYWYPQMTRNYPPPRELELKLARGKSIGGRVTDPEGKPIPDSDVRVEFEIEVDGVRRMSPFVQTRTDADGRWTASCIDPATEKVEIQVRHPQFVMGPRPQATGNRLVLRKPFQELVDRTHVTKMTPGHKFNAIVLGPDGKPVEGARAYLSQFSGLLEDAGVASNAGGSLVVGNIGSLEGAPYRTIRVIVHQPGVGWQTVNLAETQFDQPMTVRLEPPRKFTLRVVDPEGKPIAGARIISEFFPGDLALRINQITDENGIFETAEFPPGSWRLSAGHGGFDGSSVVVDASLKNDMTLTLNRAILVEGTVTDADSGKPVESFRIFQVAEESTARSRQWIGKSQGEGRFRETLIRSSKRPEGGEPKFRLRIEAEGFEPFETEPFPISKPPAKFEIALKPGTQGRIVTGRVLKSDGTPAAGAEVAFFTPSIDGIRNIVPRIENGRIESIIDRQSSFRRELTRTSNDGSFRIAVEPDRIGLVVTHESGGFRAAETGLVPQDPVELKLHPFGRIEGQLLVGGKPVTSKPLTYEYKFDDGSKESSFVIPFTVVTDENGRFAVESLVPGNVRLRYPTPSGDGLMKYLGGAVPVAAGATTKIRADVDDFGLEELVLDNAGNTMSKYASGSKEPVFRVIGYATDADTGQPVTPVHAALLTGSKGDDVKIHAHSGSIRKGAFETGPLWTRQKEVSKESIDPWLVVYANGYEPYVSPNRIPRQNASVRIDVRLKKVDSAKRKTYTGKIVRADGSPASDAKVGSTVIDDGMPVGEAKFRWLINENETVDADETGKFRIVAPRELDTLFISDNSGYAILKAADFIEALGKNSEVKLTPWSRIEGRVKQVGNPVARLVMTLTYDGASLPSDEARFDVNISRDGTFVVPRTIAIPATLSVYSKPDQGRFVLVKTVAVESKPAETTRVEVDVDATSKPEQKSQTSPISNPVSPDSKPVDPDKTANSKPGDSAKSVESTKAVGSNQPVAPPNPEFAANSGKFIFGKVLKPDGSPAAGAAVGYYTPRDGSWPRYEPRFENGRLTGILRSSLESTPVKIEIVRTDSDGKFHILADAGKIGWVVMHDSGNFRSPSPSPVDPEREVTIKLGPFARVHGILIIDGKPQADSPVLYAGPGDGKKILIPTVDSVMTDAQGRFEIPRVVPGAYRLAFPGIKPSEFWQYLAEPFEVPAGASLRVETTVAEFGHRQVVLDEAGQEVSRTGSGEFATEFLVYGRATDAVTGETLKRSKAYFLTGLEGDDMSLSVQYNDMERFHAYQTASGKHPSGATRGMDPWLVVFASGYEPYVSPRPITRGKVPVRMDVALKPKEVPAEPLKPMTGQIFRADGKPSSRAEIIYVPKTPVLKIGQSNVRWQVFSQLGAEQKDAPARFQADERGRFRIDSNEPLEWLTVYDATGCAVLTGEELAARPEGIVRLGPWARVEGRADVKPPTEGKIRAQMQYGNVAWLPFMDPPSAELRPDGTFVLEQVLPGTHKISLMNRKKIDDNSTSYSHLDPPVSPVTFETVGGQTTKLTIGAKPVEPEKPADSKAVTKITANDSKPADSSKSAGTSKPAIPPKPEFPAPSGKFITGKVLKPDGTPAAGAEVGFFTTTDDRNDRYLPRLARNSRIEAIEHRAIERGQWKNSEREPIRTDPEGRFQLPVWAEKFGWCVTHDSGVLRSTKLVEMAEGEAELKLEPWGRIEGTILLDERPMSSATLYYQPNIDIGKNTFGNPMPTGIRANHPGMFVIDRAMPGPYRFAFPNPASARDQTQYADHDLNVPAGGTLKFEVNLTMFGWEERLKDETGKIVDRKKYGAMRPGFRVYGQVVDADTGVPVEPKEALLVNGQKNETLDIIADERPGSVFSLNFLMTEKGPKVLGEVDPYLVVIAPGYLPYVSPERIKMSDSPVHHDVRLKKLPPEKTLTIEGQVLDPDGKTPYMAFFRNNVPGETVKVGETTIDWKFYTENPPLSIDKGRFRFTVRNAPGKLVFSNQVGFEEVEAAEFAKLPGGVVRLKPWGKVRLRVLRNGKPDPDFSFTNDHRESWKLRFLPSESRYPREDGTFLLDRLPPMPVELCVMGKTEKGSKYVLKTVTVEAKSGETTDVDVVVTDEELKEAKAILKARQAGN